MKWTKALESLWLGLEPGAAGPGKTTAVGGKHGQDTCTPSDGKVVAITGAARGIGKATALALTRRGARWRSATSTPSWHSGQRRSRQRMRGLPTGRDRPRIGERLRRCCRGAARADRRDDQQRRDHADRPVPRRERASIERQFSINVMGVINGMQAVIPRMLARGDGHVINIASTAGKVTVPGIATYTATKHAVVGLTGSVRAELRDTPSICRSSCRSSSGRSSPTASRRRAA